MTFQPPPPPNPFKGTIHEDAWHVASERIRGRILAALTETEAVQLEADTLKGIADLIEHVSAVRDKAEEAKAYQKARIEDEARHLPKPFARTVYGPQTPERK